MKSSILSNPVRAAAVLLVTLYIPQCAQADSIFMTAKGQRVGNIPGGVTKKGHENSMEVIAYDHEIVSPRDPASGLPTGQRQHKPLVVTIPLDKSYPVLYQVMVTNENLTQVSISYFGSNLNASGTGSQKNLWKVDLTNASISDIHQVTQPEKPFSPKRQLLQIAFTYQKIQWTWTDGAVTAMDDWQVPQ